MLSDLSYGGLSGSLPIGLRAVTERMQKSG